MRLMACGPRHVCCAAVAVPLVPRAAAPAALRPSPLRWTTSGARAACSASVARRTAWAADRGGVGARRRVVVAGCGVAGASAAMHLAKRGAEVTIVEPRSVLSATSQYSTECYRNFFLDEALVPLMSRSVDIMEDLAGDDNTFNLNRRGYCFLSATADGEAAFEEFAEVASGFGAGPVRRHRGGADGYVRSPPRGFQHPDMVGFDLVYGSSAIREIFPFVTDNARIMLHARRCGWMDAQGMGQAMLRAAKSGSAHERGAARVLQGSVAGFDMAGGDISRVRVAQDDGSEISLDCDAFVNCAGAWTSSVNALLAPDSPLPLQNEIHCKVILNDTLGIIPQDVAPFMVWRDRVAIDWSEDDIEGLKEFDDTSEGGIVNSAEWIKPQPGGQHLRPAGNGRVLMLWEHLHRHVALPDQPAMPIEQHLDMYPELCVAGLQAMVPQLRQYDGRLGRNTTVDGGYYTVTADGRPIISQHGAGNAFVCGGMGTYGLMASPAAGELVAQLVMGDGLPSYSAACSWPRKEPLTVKPVDLLDESA